MLAPLREFLRLESAGGILLIAAAFAAMIVANSPFAGTYLSVVGFHARLGFDFSLLHAINDGLMAVFFLLIGLELKREVLGGQLSTWRAASLPAFAAVGGMIGPAAIYAALNAGDPIALRGWAIPAATDIAFALGVFLLLGSRASSTLKVFLLSIAVFDDLGAIVIIALFYTSSIALVPLAVAAACVGILAWMNLSGVRRLLPYLIVGLPLWLAILKSGIHATLAGVILAVFIPFRVADNTTSQAGEATPLRRLEHTLHPWVAFGIIPIFAIANAGVPVGGLSFTDFFHPVPLGIATGLLFGKPIGILAMSVLAVRLGVAALPAHSNWKQIAGLSVLCGVGFTMSLFIASLSWNPGSGFNGLDRLGILAGSVLSSLAGYALLRFALPARQEAE